MILPYKIFFWLLCQGYAYEIPIHYAMDCLKKIDAAVQSITEHHNTIDPEDLAVIRNLSNSFQNEETKQLLDILSRESIITQRASTLSSQEKTELVHTVEQLSENISKMGATLNAHSKMVIHPADRTQMCPFTLDPRISKICSMIQDACASNSYAYARAGSMIAAGIGVIAALCWWYNRTSSEQHAANAMLDNNEKGCVTP